MKLRALASIGMILALPGIAEACPSCATRSTPATVFLWIGLMIAVPYVIAVVAIRAIRRLERES